MHMYMIDVARGIHSQYLKHALVITCGIHSQYLKHALVVSRGLHSQKCWKQSFITNTFLVQVLKLFSFN